ncbi:MAG TPA: hypothetical protein VLV76_18770 [Candidatus Acidoferrum sp.]|nr:hypothetical protein [Candidatus Acidoferrum sp.]
MFVWSFAMYPLHELLRHHPAYLMGRSRQPSDFERLEYRPVVINDEFQSEEPDALSWRFADAVVAVLVALAVWVLIILTTGPIGGSPRVETIAESADVIDRP